MGIFELIPRDLLLYIFQFVHLPEWGNWRLLNKEQHQKVGNLYSFMQRFVQEELQKLITCDYFKFIKALKESNGCITGSIFIQILLGKDLFQAQNLNCFIENNNTNLTTALFEIYFNQKIKMISYASIHEFNTFLFETSLHRDIYVDSMVDFANMRITELQPKKNYTLLSITKHFIENYFDFSICTSYFDGEYVKLRAVGNMYRRELVILPWFHNILEFLNMKEYPKRIARFKANGFHLKTPYKPEQYNKIYKQVLLEGDEDVIEKCILLKKRKLEQ